MCHIKISIEKRGDFLFFKINRRLVFFPESFKDGDDIELPCVTDLLFTEVCHLNVFSNICIGEYEIGLPFEEFEPYSVSECDIEKLILRCFNVEELLSPF